MKLGAASTRRFVYSCFGCSRICFAAPCSTTSPRYITSTRSARSTASGRSCVIRMTDAPSSSVSASRRSSTRRCTVTSRALVGSSAMSSRGWHASPMAISTRCRMPPENSCGYWSMRCSASGMPTISSSSTTRCRLFSPPAPWARSTSRIWSPMRCIGLRFDIGSCGTRPICAPRRLLRSRSAIVVISAPSKRTEPPEMRPLLASSRLRLAAIVDLPDPDSPTIASVSPGSTSNETPLTASNSPRAVENATRRSSTLSSGSVTQCLLNCC